MSPFNSVSGFCGIQNKNVEVLMIKLKTKQKKNDAMTPVRCQNASECPKSSFCRFVNPLTTRMPVVFNKEEARPEAKSAEAS